VSRLAAAVVVLACAAGCTVSGTSPFGAIDSTPPKIDLVLPVEGASNVQPDVELRFYFSEPLDDASLGGADIGLVSGPLSAPGHLDRAQSVQGIYGFVPDAPLATDVKWTLTVPGTLTDLYGNPMGKDYVSHFTTSGAGAAFVVNDVSPADGATGVATDVTISVFFGYPVPDRFVTPVNFFVEDAGGRRVSAQVGPQTGSNGLVVTLAPRVALTASTAYTVHVAKGLFDTSAQALAAEYVSTFTTGP